MSWHWWLETVNCLNYHMSRRKMGVNIIYLLYNLIIWQPTDIQFLLTSIYQNHQPARIVKRVYRSRRACAGACVSTNNPLQEYEIICIKILAPIFTTAFLQHRTYIIYSGRVGMWRHWGVGGHLLQESSLITHFLSNMVGARYSALHRLLPYRYSDKPVIQRLCARIQIRY
jgi:hypothetical protein